MDIIIQSGVDLILSLQKLGAWLSGPMSFFTFLGNEEFFLLIAPALYWCIDSATGLRIGLYLMLSGGVNNVLKFSFHGPRPYWLDTRVSALSSEGSFGLPSGHAQHAVVVWGALAAQYGQWALTLVLIFLIGFSRLYLGMHFPSDVLAGWLIGTILLGLMLKLEKPVISWLKQYTLNQQISFALLVSLLMIAAGLLGQAALGDWSLPPEWINNAAAANPAGEPINPLSLAGLVTNAAVFFGLAAGALWMQGQGGFNAGGSLRKRLIRYLAGISGILVIWFGLNVLFPHGDSLLAYTFRYARYMLVGLWVTGFAPYIFKRVQPAADIDRGV